MPGKRGRGLNPAGESIIKQAVIIHPAVRAVAQHAIRVDDNTTIPTGSVILVQPLNDDTAHLNSKILNYKLCTIKELAPGEKPESKRDIEVDQVHYIDLQNHYHALPIIWKMYAQIGHTTEGDVRKYLRKQKHPIGKAAFVHSAGTKLFYVDSNGTITELPSGKISFPSHGYGKALSIENSKIFYDSFEGFSHFKYTEYYKLLPINTPIFPTESSPSIDEIRQMRIPDCFLLAALQSILVYEDGKKFIKGMMTDHGDGTVSVRLFDPETNAPFYVRVVKAELHENGKPLNEHTALWVHIIETAYASVGQKFDRQVGPSAAAVFSGGGQANFALKILTGQECKYTPIPLLSNNTTPSFTTKIAFDSIVGTIDMMREAKMPEEDIARQFQMQIVGVFPDVVFIGDSLKYEPKDQDKEMSIETIKNLELLIDFYKKNKKEYNNILDNEQTTMIEKIDLILALLELKNTPENDLKILLDLFRSVKQESCIPFSGDYSQKTMEIYKTIRHSFDYGNSITTGTHDIKKFANAGFEPFPGIACGHAYSVHDAYSELVEIGNSKRRIFYITIRNPWGTMGREYEPNGSGIGYATSEKPMFDIELNEFVTIMDGFTILKKESLFYFDKLRERIQAVLEKSTLSFPENMSDEELLRNKRKLDFVMDTFFEMELLHLSDISKETREKIAVILSSEERFSIQEKEVLAILQEKEQHIHFYTGEHENKNIHLFNLFKFKQLSTRGDKDTEELAYLRKRIIGLSGNRFSDHIMTLNKEFDTLLLRKISDLEENIAQLESRLKRILIDSQKAAEDESIDAEDFNVVKYSTVETLSKLLQDIANSKELLQQLGYTLPKKQEELLQKLIEDIKPYNQGYVSSKIEAFENDLIVIKKSFEKLDRAKQDKDVDPEIYQDILNSTLAIIDKTTQECAIIITDLEAAHHPLTQDMQEKLDDIVNEASSYNKTEEKESSFLSSSRFSFHSFNPLRSLSRRITGSSSDNSPERVASSSSGSSSPGCSPEHSP